MALKRIRLELAGASEFPESRPGCGYEFTAPLDRTGKLDMKSWASEKHHCSVRRFWHSTIDEHGTLVHHRGNEWAFAWPDSADGEKPIFRLDKHAFTIGEYVSLTERDGVSRTFRVVAIEPVH